MKKLILALLAVALLISVSHSATYYPRTGNAQRYNQGGQVLVSSRAQIWVYNAGSTTLATIYSTSAGSITSQPIVADRYGNYLYYAVAGSYDERIVGPTGTEAVLIYGIVIGVSDLITAAGASLPDQSGKNGLYLRSTGTVGAEVWSAMSGTVGTSFDYITSGTNTTSTLTVGSGATLAPSGSGTIYATHLNAVAGTLFLTKPSGTGLLLYSGGSTSTSLYGGASCTGNIVTGISSTGLLTCVATATGAGTNMSGVPVITTTPSTTLDSEVALSTLGSGFLLNTTGTGSLYIYTGGSCAPNIVSAISATGLVSCATDSKGLWAGSSSSCSAGNLVSGISATGLVSCATDSTGSGAVSWPSGTGPMFMTGGTASVVSTGSYTSAIFGLNESGVLGFYTNLSVTVGTQYGGTNQDTSAWTGYAYVSSGTWTTATQSSGSGNVISSNTPSAGMIATFVTDSLHIQGATVGSGLTLSGGSLYTTGGAGLGDVISSGSPSVGMLATFVTDSLHIQGLSLGTALTTSGTNTLYVQLPENVVFKNPQSGDLALLKYSNTVRYFELSSICTSADGSVVIDWQLCNADGASCVSMLSSTATTSTYNVTHSLNTASTSATGGYWQKAIVTTVTNTPGTCAISARYR